MPAKPGARSFAARPGPRAHAGAGDRSSCPLVGTAHPTPTTGGPGSGNHPTSSGKPEKNPEFFHFFCDSGILRDCSAGRSTVAAHRPGAAPSPQPSERTGNILKVRPARPGRVSGFRENGKPESRTMAGQGGWCGGRRGAAGQWARDGTR